MSKCRTLELCSAMMSATRKAHCVFEIMSHSAELSAVRIRAPRDNDNLGSRSGAQNDGSHIDVGCSDSLRFVSEMTANQATRPDVQLHYRIVSSSCNGDVSRHVAQH